MLAQKHGARATQNVVSDTNIVGTSARGLYLGQTNRRNTQYCAHHMGQTDNKHDTMGQKVVMVARPWNPSSAVSLQAP